MQGVAVRPFKRLSANNRFYLVRLDRRNQMRKFKRLIALAATTLLTVSMAPAMAAPLRVQIDDAGENLTLYVVRSDGQRVAITPGNGDRGDGVSDLKIDNSFNQLGERMQFDIKLADMGPVSDDGKTPAESVYTQLLGGPSDLPFKISDEFLIINLGSGLFYVDFVSFDSDSGVMQSLHQKPDPNDPNNPRGKITLPDPSPNLSKVERADYQDVAYFLNVPEPYTVATTFQVVSVDEPVSGALMILGLAGLAAGLRRKLPIDRLS
jgi:hypothetical protein